MAHDPHTLEDSNRSANPSVHEVSDPARRQWLAGGLSALLWPLAGCSPTTPPARTPAQPSRLLGFRGIATSTADRIVVPEGYSAQVLAPWGEPVGIAGAMPAWRPDASNSAAEQAVQMGMHHDGLHFFALDDSHTHGLLVMNHEYTDDGLLHPEGLRPWTAEKVHKAQAAHGISVIEVERVGPTWQMRRPSHFARRITATTPCQLGGPAAGHPLMRTAFDPSGHTVLGTLNNCAAGMTPWGTYLSGEENFAFYFDGGKAITTDQRRWGLNPRGFMRWAPHDERFDASRHPNEFNRFGWIVELDPMAPNSPPIKRTALGRAAHEGAWVAVTKDGRAVVYSGEDARFEYLYKFVSRERIRPAGHGLTQAQANRELLDHGTLSVARFDADGTGRWLPLVHGQGPLTAANGFADQAEVLIKTRQASDLLGATKMDRPEWLAIDTTRGEVFCALTNNSARGTPGQPGADAANPHAPNPLGHILRWKEGDDFDADHFTWRHLVHTGDTFGSPDGLAFDARGVLWVQTDAHASQLHRGEYTKLGNNQMLACDPTTGEVRRFLTGPVNCEVTGCAFTPDGTTMFVNIQHPGEPPSDVSDPSQPLRHSSWPDGAGRPRSATVVVRRLDGGVIGA